MCLVTILTKGVSDSEAGQAEAQHCNKSQNIHMAQPSFPKEVCKHPLYSLSGFYVNGGSQSLRRGLTAYHLGIPKEMVTQFDKNFNQIFFSWNMCEKYFKINLIAIS